MPTGDKKTIGVSSSGEDVLRRVCGGNPFETELDAARFAVALAITEGTWPPPKVETGTKWNVGSFDPSGDLKSILEMLMGPVEEPYRSIEYLLDTGLQMLAEHLRIHGAIDLEVLLQDKARSEAGG